MKACLDIRLKLSLLQLSSKFLILGFFILIVNPVYAIELGLSPSSIAIDTKNGEEACFNLKIYTDRQTDVYLEDYWNNKGRKNVRDYTYRAEDFGITMNYIKDVRADEITSNRICVKGERGGKYYGFLLVRNNQRKIGVGMWIEFSNGDAEERMLKGGAGITGAFAGHPSGELDIIGLLIILQLLLMLALIGLLLMLARKKRQLVS